MWHSVWFGIAHLPSLKVLFNYKYIVVTITGFLIF